MYEGIARLNRGLRLFAKARKHVTRAIDDIRRHKAENDARLHADHAEADAMLDDARRLHLAAEEHRLCAVSDHAKVHETLSVHEDRALKSLTMLDQITGAS